MDYFGIRPNQMGVGNVYHVIQAGHGELAELTDYHEKTYLDGSSAVHATIATALTASQAERNDYIIVRPDNDFYDNSATLTMDKNDVHLIAPSNIGTGMGSFRTVVRETGSATVLTISGHGVEVAGLFLAGKEGYTLMDYGSGTVWSAYIHDNYFGMYAEYQDTSNYGLYAGGALNNHCIRDNTFTNFSAAPSGNNNAVAGFIHIKSASTRGLIKGNILHTGPNTTVACGIYAEAYAEMIIENHLWEDVAFGASEAGTFTVGINASVNSLLARNIIGIATTANAIAYAPVDGCIENYVSSGEGGILGYTGSST